MSDSYVINIEANVPEENSITNNTLFCNNANGCTIFVENTVSGSKVQIYQSNGPVNNQSLNYTLQENEQYIVEEN